MIARSPAHDSALMLADEGVGVFGGAADWAISVGGLTERPENSISVLDDGGPGMILYPEEIHRPQVQVLVRSKDYVIGWQKINEIVFCFLDMGRHEYGVYFYWGYDQTGDVMALGQDDRGLFLFSANLYLHRQIIT